MLSVLAEACLRTAGASACPRDCVENSPCVQRVVFKVAAWALAATLAVLIICSRKHYTVDILIAWYVVPLVFLALERRYTTKERNDADALKSGASVELQTILVADIDGASGQEPADGLLQPIELEAHAGSATGTVYEGAGPTASSHASLCGLRN